MAKQTLGRLPRFNTIGLPEKRNVARAMRYPLSGYLGGVYSAGYWVERLQSEWCVIFNCRHAIACNSATSGLLAACMAAGVGPGDEVWTSAYTMSASAACAKVLGAHIVPIDIETIRFSMNTTGFASQKRIPKCIIVTNLFGHPAYLSRIRSWCDSNKVIMIEDNAQAPFAMEGDKYAGTIGHLGVFSLNIHKSIQAGEGGVVVSNNDVLSHRVAEAINHGELSGGITGLNLRMTEITAAIACAQVRKGESIIEGRRQLAMEITDMFSGVPGISPPLECDGCRHVYYMWAAKVVEGKRDKLIKSLTDSEFPMQAGYSVPLNRIFAPDVKCPVAEGLEDTHLISFEVCAYSPSKRQLRKMREIAKRATGK